jgi:hypothetical protein
MTRARPFRFVSLMLALALASLGAVVSGCGIAGDVTPAPPMWGQTRADYDAEQARKREEEAKAAPKAAPKATPTNPAPSSPPTR